MSPRRSLVTHTDGARGSAFTDGHIEEGAAEEKEEEEEVDRFAQMIC